jgi:ubiquinone biosynthesis protein
LRRNLPRASEQLPLLPELGYKVLTDASTGRLKMRWESTAVEALHAEVRRSSRRTVAVVSGAALVVSAILMAGLPNAWLPPVVLESGAAALAGAGVLLLVKAWRT